MGNRPPSAAGPRILDLMADGRPRTSRELAEELGCPAAALTAVLTALHRHQRIERVGTREVVDYLGRSRPSPVWRVQGARYGWAAVWAAFGLMDALRASNAAQSVARAHRLAGEEQD